MKVPLSLTSDDKIDKKLINDLYMRVQLVELSQLKNINLIFGTKSSPLPSQKIRSVCEAQF